MNIFKWFQNPKQDKRLIAIQEARKELSRWQDIPLSQQAHSIGSILNYLDKLYISDQMMSALSMKDIYTDIELADMLPTKWFK